MCSKKAVYQFVNATRPIVQILLENPHDSSVKPIQYPALIDTGAYTSVVPAFLCRALGHTFEDGLFESTASGIGEGARRTFTHSTKMTVLFPMESDDNSSQTFESSEFPCEFIEQFLPCILLGQQDFLRLFRYAQDGRAGWFSLEQITSDTNLP